MNFSWIDILIVGIFLFSTVRGFIQGFVKSFLSFFLIIGALILANIFSGDLSAYCYENCKWVENLHDFIENNVINIFGGNISADGWTSSTQVYNTPNSLQNILDNFINTANNTLGNIADTLANNITAFVLNIISFLAIFLAVYLLGKLLIALINRFSQLPVINTFNKAGGLLFGLVKGLLIVCIISTILYYLNLMLGAVGLSTAINNSFLIKYFYIEFLF